MAMIVSRKNDGEISIHWHNAFEIVHLLQGQISVLVDSDRAPIPVWEGDSVLLPPGCAHDIRSHVDASEVLIIQFTITDAMNVRYGIRRSLNLLADDIDTVRIIRKQDPYAAQTTFLCHEIRRVQQEQDPSAADIVGGALQMLLTYFGTEKPLTPMLPGIENSKLDLVKMCAYIDECKLGGVTLDAVAEYMGYSKKHFALIFKKMTGKTFKQFLDQLKMQEARRLLGEGKRASEIACMLGYSCVQSFYRAFKRIHKVSTQEMLSSKK